MTNYEQLREMVLTNNKRDLFQWLRIFITWINPEGEYHDDEMLNNYLDKEFMKPKFKVGDIVHHKNFNIYGVVTYVNYENCLYSIVTDSGEAVNDYNDFKSVDNLWEITDRRMAIDGFLNTILPPELRR